MYRLQQTRDLGQRLENRQDTDAKLARLEELIQTEIARLESHIDHSSARTTLSFNITPPTPAPSTRVASAFFIIT